MKRKTLFRKFSKILAVSILTGALLLSGCTSASEISDNNTLQGTETSASANGTNDTQGAGQVADGTAAVQVSNASVTTIDVSDMFSKRDQKTEYDESECILVTLDGTTATCENDAVKIEEGTVLITAEGSYILRGSFTGSIRVEAPDDAKVQLILDGVSITQSTTAAIYVKTADKVFLTTAEGSTNVITNTGDFVKIDDNNIDGAIYSKTDLTLNGNGTLTVSSEKGHGIVSKDDLKITSGTYEITAGDHGISGKDSIRILDGTINVTATQDGLHSGNDEDADKGYVYIAGGNITISAGDDGIHGETKVVIADGTINVTKSTEGIEGVIVEIAGGDITVVASDDGINAADGSSSQGFGGRGGFGQGSTANTNVYVLISGGVIRVDAKGDGIDANGSVYVKGGETYVNGPENNGNGALDYDATGEITGGSFIAIGASGMAMNFSSSTQGSALVTTSSTHKAGETVTLKDADGNVIISCTATRSFNSVVVSSPLMKQGGTYTLTIGSETQTFTLDQLIYGQSNGFGGFGGQMPGGQGGGFNGQMPGGFNGNEGGFGGGRGGNRNGNGKGSQTNDGT